MAPERDPGSEIVADNIRAVQTIYFACMLEEMRAFQVAERLAQNFAQGLLPIRSEKTRKVLLAIGFRNERMTEQDRRSLYARALGMATGEAGEVQPNREFLSLWLRFLVAVVAYADQHGAATVLAPPTATNAAVRQIARSLATNVSAHGVGLTGQMAALLLAEVHETIDLLGSRDVLHAYGARDAWQVIELVSRNDLGEARNVPRFRTQATAGSQVLRWLAEHSDVLDDQQAQALAATPEGSELVEAAEQMLSVSHVAADKEPAPPSTGTDDLASLPRLGFRHAVRDLVDSVGLADVSPHRMGDSDGPRGPVVVFHGERHTGKTIAAYELAHALGRELFRVDLSHVVSRYAGETEKNLDAVFQRAEELDAVLLLDEADALLGKRSEVRDAHDRYAGIEVAYLLQRLEEHRGPVILTTRRKDDIDPAFLRRLRYVVEFPRPR